MKVRQLMKPGARSCTSEDSLNTAAQIMWDNDCGCVPVRQSDGRVVGMITDRDICMAAYLQGGPLRALTVSSAMSKEVFTCQPDDTIAHAEAFMREHRVRRLPVIDNGHLIGILSLSDLADEAEHEAELKKKQVTFAEVGQTLRAVCKPRAVLAA